MTRTSSPTDMDGCVVAMHLARANMVIHEWDEAIKYAQVVIDNFLYCRVKTRYSKDSVISACRM